KQPLHIAVQPQYRETEVPNVPDDLRGRYFEKVGERYSFRADLRRSIIFGRLDVLRDAPISRLEVLACRNTLMYFNAETQAQAIARFHFALNDGAVLMLGKAETLLSHSTMFEPIERKLRVFRKMTGGDDRDRIPDRSLLRANTDGASSPQDIPAAVFSTSPVAALLFDPRAALIDV